MIGNGADTTGITGAICCRTTCRHSNENSMKKIGILFGQENSFPWAFIDRVNQKSGGEGIVAEAVRIDKVIQGEPCGPRRTLHRLFQDGPPFFALLKTTNDD